MKIFKKDKKLKKQVRKLAIIKQLKHEQQLLHVNQPQNSLKLFNQFDINEMILRALTAMNFTHATDIQSKILPDALQFKDIIASEKTGSGKTLAYLIPLLNLVLKFRFRIYHGTCAIVLVPSKELCVQVCSVFSQLAQFTNVSFNLIHGDTNHKDEEALLATGCTVLFATPNSLYHHMKSSEESKTKRGIDYFRYHNVKCVVLDEADRLLEDHCEGTIGKIMESLPFVRQTMILSATLNLDDHSMDKKIKSFAKSFMSPSYLSVNMSDDDSSAMKTKRKKNITNDKLTEGFVIVDARDRLTFLFNLTKDVKDKKVIIFFSSSEQVQFYYNFLNLCNTNNENLVMLHSNLTSNTRTLNLIKFNSLKSGFLLCTDVISRGIDIPEVELVVQFDLPIDRKSYVHRVGRTARGGMNGTAILLLRTNESEQVLKCLKEMTMSLIEFETRKLHDINGLIQQIQNNSQLYSLANRALVAQLEAYKNSEFISSMNHIKLEDEIINFLLKDVPKLPKSLAINDK